MTTTMYRIRHKTTGQYFVGKNNKSVWVYPGHAKNAWNAEHSGYQRSARGATYHRPRFSEQDAWECVEVDLIPTGVIK